MTFREVGPAVDSSVVFAVYEAEAALNPDKKTRVHSLAVLTLRFPDGKTMRVSPCPVICRSVGGWLHEAGDAYLNDYLDELWAE